MTFDPSQLDLTSLTWQQFALVGIVTALVDWGWATIQAIRPPNQFSLKLALNVLYTHVLLVVAPIAGLAALAWSFPADSLAHGGLYAAAAGFLALYVGATVKSLIETKQRNDALDAAAREPETLDDGEDEILPGVPS
jgi:hypothetical protein